MLTSCSLIVLLSVLLFFTASAFTHSALSRRLFQVKMAAAPASFYDIVERDDKGNEVSFEKFRGKVVYGVNVASRCGYTQSGYALLSRVAALKERGVEVCVFPCNQFGAQEPGSDAEIATFCLAKGVKGATVFTKADVNGPNTRPTYSFLKSKGVLGDIAWNFAGKFIVDQDGNVRSVRSDSEVEPAILGLLSK